MCNLFSQTRNREAIARLFRVGHNRADLFDPLPAISPGNDAPVVRQAQDGERELRMLSWGFVLNLKGQAPKRVTNLRDDKLSSPFWASSFIERRCLVPVTSFAEPKGRSPATWHWFALDEAREPFSFAGIWRHHKGPVRKDGDPVEIDVFAFITTKPNELVTTIHPSRMPVMLVSEEAQAAWIDAAEADARAQIQRYPADGMTIVQSRRERQDLLN